MEKKFAHIVVLGTVGVGPTLINIASAYRHKQLPRNVDRGDLILTPRVSMARRPTFAGQARDPVANLGRGEPAEHVQLDHEPLILVEALEHLLEDDPQLDRAGLAVNRRLGAPDVVLTRVLALEARLFWRRFARRKKSTVARSTTVCSQLRKSPTDVESNAAAIARTNASWATSSTACAGSRSERRRLTSRS